MQHVSMKKTSLKKSIQVKLNNYSNHNNMNRKPLPHDKITTGYGLIITYHNEQAKAGTVTFVNSGNNCYQHYPYDEYPLTEFKKMCGDKASFISCIDRCKQKVTIQVINEYDEVLNHLTIQNY
jgi:hypothetical protein